MKTETKERIKLALRRFTLRWLRKAFDALEERLHAAEVRLRENLVDDRRDLSPVRRDGCGLTSDIQRPADRHNLVEREDQENRPVVHETFLEWEARKSGVAPVSKKVARARRQRAGAASFDLRFSQ